MPETPDEFDADFVDTYQRVVHQVELLRAGQATPIDVAKYVWDEDELIGNPTPGTLRPGLKSRRLRTARVVDSN